MPTIDIDDTTLYYERDGDGPAMLFVHGMCGDAEVWADQARRFADRYTCVRYDRRGHSRSGRGDAPISAAQHADDAAALIEALGLAPCLIVGSSSGAVIAVDVALRHGHLLRGAVLSEPPLFSLDPDGRPAAHRRARPARRAGDRRRRPARRRRRFLLVRSVPACGRSIDETRKDRYRANADIGFTDLRSPSLDVVAVETGRGHDPGPRRHRRRQPSVVAVRRPPAGGRAARRPSRRTGRLRSRHLRRAARTRSLTPCRRSPPKSTGARPSHLEPRRCDLDGPSRVRRRRADLHGGRRR